MNRLKLCLWIWLGVAVAGCEFVHPPTEVDFGEPSVVVHGVLAAGADRVAVLVTRVGPQEEYVPGRTYLFEPGIDPLSRAEVRLVMGVDTLRLAEGAIGFGDCLGNPTPDAGPGCYVAPLPGGVRSGVAYRLHVRLPDGRVIEGEATPPPPPVVVAPERHARLAVRIEYSNVTGLTLGSVPVRFRAPAGVAGVGAAIDGPSVAFLGGARAEDVECRITTRAPVSPAEGADSVTLRLDTFHCFQHSDESLPVAVRPDSVHARLYLTGYDSAFLRYQDLLSEKQVHPSLASQGLSGALGLFAGEATIEQPVTLVPID